MGVNVGVLVEVPVAVGVDVLVTVGVKVGLSVAVGTGVDVCVAVLVGTIASLGMLVLVGGNVGTGVDIEVGVFAGVTVTTITTGAGVDCNEAKKRRTSSVEIAPFIAANAIIAAIMRSPQSMTLPTPQSSVTL
ncbi:MAG: hypothetical protein F4X34_03195 [Chloroflexi bacterium]|nr:hypothetical protein [Chloroflexota bacterium]